MALDFNRKNQSSDSADDSWKADAFQNIYFPTDTGGRVKLGVIYLKKDNADQNELIEAFAACKTQDEVDALQETIRSLMIFDYRLSVDPTRGKLTLAPAADAAPDAE